MLATIESLEVTICEKVPSESRVLGAGRVVLTTEQHTSDGGREEDVRGRCQDRIIDQCDVAVTVGQSSIAESETRAVARSSRVGGDENNVAILNDTDGSIRGDEKEK